jgi:ABC-type amino acid transport substrate-binding protein
MPFHLLVRKDSPYAALLPRFDEIIAALHRDGTIRRIVDSYVGRAGSGGPE